eukprot:TRINITY_DN38034_c0_g1_i1.p1 TRINITY_DN38034_c0_g1~~TRINITY_DN38034_c0_g1_i1.p1  ORF type:complete len:525 (-),score=115.92 TRINITY_DN38034_c0_g1_i1:32-1606(-)
MICRSMLPQRSLRILRIVAYVTCWGCSNAIERHDAHSSQAVVSSDGHVSGLLDARGERIAETSQDSREHSKARQIMRSAERPTTEELAADTAEQPPLQRELPKRSSHLVLFPPRHSLLEKALASNSSAALASSVATLLAGHGRTATALEAFLAVLVVGCLYLGYRRVFEAPQVGGGDAGTALVDTGATDSSIVGALFCATIWMFLSGSLTLYNAWMYSAMGGNFPYVIALTCWHQFLNIMLTLTVRVFFPHLMPAAVGGLKGVDSVHLLRVVGLQASLVCGTLVLGNKAYLYLSVALIQVIKAAMPLMTYMISCCFGMEALTGSMTGVIVAIIAGMTMTVTGELKPSMVGLALQFSSFVVEGLRLVCLRRMVSDHGINLDPLSGLLFYAPICCVSLAALACITGEFHEVLALEHLPLKHLLVNGLLACGLNVAGVFLLRQASATTLAVCGVLKDLTLVGLSIPLFGNSLTMRQVGGLITILVSVRLYNKLKEDPDYMTQKLEQFNLLPSSEKSAALKSDDTTDI